jgi:hypothetical protein
MNTSSWKEVSSRLRRQAAGAGPRPAEEFWADFRARAALMRQDTPDAVRERAPLALRWAYAVAAALVLVAVSLFILPGQPAAVTRIKAMEVVAPHSGVIIMNDDAGKGTIVWIAGMESGNGSG